MFTLDVFLLRGVPSYSLGQEHPSLQLRDRFQRPDHFAAVARHCSVQLDVEMQERQAWMFGALREVMGESIKMVEA